MLMERFVRQLKSIRPIEGHEVLVHDEDLILLIEALRDPKGLTSIEDARQKFQQERETLIAKLEATRKENLEQKAVYHRWEKAYGQQFSQDLERAREYAYERGRRSTVWVYIILPVALLFVIHMKMDSDRQRKEAFKGYRRIGARHACCACPERFARSAGYCQTQ
jgi:hypothetical protein